MTVLRRTPQVSVAIVTWLRPEYVSACLEHLASQDRLPDEVLVVDASDDSRTAAVVERFPWARRIAFPEGAGHLTAARNVALLEVAGDIVVFIDDDAYVRPGWLAGLLDAFADESVAAVAGRTCNGMPGEESAGLEEIGRILPDGTLTANFAADPGAIIDVDHGIGANMAFRRDVLARLGGFRDDFGGPGVCEETDMFLRLRQLGYRVVFVPAASIDHVSAPHVKGKRFDFRYLFWARRNHVLLLARDLGFASRQLRGFVAHELRHPFLGEAGMLRRSLRRGLAWLGVMAGLLASVRKAGWRAADPLRRDETGEAIRRHLGPAE